MPITVHFTYAIAVALGIEQLLYHRQIGPPTHYNCVTTITTHNEGNLTNDPKSHNEEFKGFYNLGFPSNDALFLNFLNVMTIMQILTIYPYIKVRLKYVFDPYKI
jgi:hypothetical protein